VGPDALGPVADGQTSDDRAATLAILRTRLDAQSTETGSRPRPGGRPAVRGRRDPEPAGQPAGDPKRSEDDEGRSAEQTAKAVCLRLLTDSARPRADLEKALRKRGFEADVIGRVLDRFEEVGLIDDKAYAEAFVRSGYHHRALSRTALESKLRTKGVDPETAADAAADIGRDAEEERAAGLVAKKVTALRSVEPDVARRRLLGMLARRGYPGDVSIRVVDAALNHPEGE
jgi:regulatory protein